MKNILLYILVFGCTFVSFAQKTQDELFNEEANYIKNSILKITKTEKDALKKSVDSINTLLENNKISFDQANKLKEKEAQKRAEKIEKEVNSQNDKLSKLVQSKVDGNVKSSRTGTTITLTITDGIKIHENGKSIVPETAKTRFFITLAYGYNTLVSDQNMPYYNSDKFNSDFFEWGFTLKTKLKKNESLMNLRYGLSFVYNGASPDGNYFFVKNGNQTDVVDSGINLSKNKFRNTYMTLPVHFELDFGGVDKYRLGLGGFVGYNLSSTQILKYRENGRRVKDDIKNDWNVNDWNYGLSAYLGYGTFSLYAKYDLNPLFRNNSVEQHNLSFGLRMDL